jgi:gliding motility-associated-like protein
MKKLIFILFLLPFFSIGQSTDNNVKYIENKGQWEENILYKANIPEGEVYLEDNKFTYNFLDFKTIDSLHHLSHDKNEEDFLGNAIISSFSYKVQFLGANKNATKSSSNKLKEYYNYYIGNDKSKWKGNVRVYNIVEYTSLYDRIDLKVYSDNQFLKYDFIVAPGANTNNIQLFYNGITPKINNNQLEIDLGFNTIIEQEPYAYQIINGIRKEVKCQYVLKDNIISFIFPNGYDNTIELIIDPTLIASTLSGTNGSDNYGHSATYGMNDEIFTGAINFGFGYPTNTGSFQQNSGGSIDIVISKLNPDGSSLLWATYLGGGGGDYPHSMMVNNMNELYVKGTTYSNNYPISANAFSNSLNGSNDICITHLTQDGTNILGSTYIGGSLTDGVNSATNNYGDTYRGEIIVDDIGNVYISSSTHSTNFPTSPGCFQSYNAGGQDGVTFKMNPNLSILEWSTYLGSPGNDAAFGIRLDGNNNVFITGTASDNFPTTLTSAIPNSIGGYDAFVVKLNPTVSTLLSSTYFGSISGDASFFIDLDVNDEVYIYGQNNEIIPITSGCYGTANSNQFIAKFTNDLSTIIWQTSIGSGGTSFGYDFVPIAFMVDVCSHIYISGHSATIGLFTTANAFYTSGGFYLMSLSPDATNLEFATYYTESHVDGGTSRFDPTGTVYQAVCSGGGFATTANAYSQTQSGGWDIGVFKIDFELINIANISASPSDTGCAPFTVDFTNNSSANTYFWDFDDNGQTSTLSNPTYTFNNPGVYEIKFIATDTSTCSMVDTVFLQIVVLQPLSSSTSDTAVCDSYNWNGTTYTTSGTYNQSFSANLACDSIAYLNLIVNYSNSGADTIISCKSYTWLSNNITYTNSGNYSAILTNANGCDSTASLDLTITNTIFTSEQKEICDKFTWNTNSETYTESGIYIDTITNTNNCDTIITLDLTIIKSSHGYDSIGTCYEYTWPLNSLTYSSQGDFIDTIISSLGCDSIVHLILRFENITFFVPNSFTPNQDDHNELFRVVSDEDIQDFKFQIYNRWGKEVFHTNNIGKGWDGIFNKKFVEQGVYVWKVQYSCKGKIQKSIGTVTLIH